MIHPPDAFWRLSDEVALLWLSFSLRQAPYLCTSSKTFFCALISMWIMPSENVAKTLKVKGGLWLWWVEVKEAQKLTSIDSKPPTKSSKHFDYLLYIKKGVKTKNSCGKSRREPYLYHHAPSASLTITRAIGEREKWSHPFLPSLISVNKSLSSTMVQNNQESSRKC